MNRLKLQPHFEWAQTSVLNQEDSMIERIDLVNKWEPLLKDVKRRKWLLKRLIKSKDVDTVNEAIQIYLHLYG